MYIGALAGGCWYCGEDDEQEDLDLYSLEFDCNLHSTCLVWARELNPEDREMQIIDREFASDYARCPLCYHQHDDYNPDKQTMKITGKHQIWTDYGLGEDWTEVWTCEVCGNQWCVDNGYP